MGATLNIFLAILLLSITHIACAAPCGVSDITIDQVKTGGVVEGKPEYEVTVSNKCQCAQSKVFLQCYGLSSVEPVDPRVIKPVDGERCIVGEGQLIPGGARIKFKYAWMTPQDFPVVSSQVLC
ncbi:protein TAPETUM DETERMINANT 1-like [Cocos nucifera]|uniref:Protein TAPETUM DETERMINANT 1-like n=1 Tax=Cocos nucifera TaxID=13894 RepID=A0A8K0IQG4_COCNU|nr:protein TAPETUM DETERMINANT 1-like [Cocos nucifera]